MAPRRDSVYFESTESSEDDRSDNEDGEYVVTIDLNNPASNQSISAAKRRTTSNFQKESKYRPEKLDIVAATVYKGGDDSNFRITTKDGPENAEEESATAIARWVHFQTDSISFEHFERLAINATLQHHSDLVPVVMYLLRKVQLGYEESSAYGSFIQPGTVLRCDGTNQKHLEKPDLSAIFISCPYFDIGKWRPPHPPKDNSLHLTRGLFQCQYTQEVTLDREGDQIFRKFRSVHANQYLRVPQLWAMVLQSETIITCGPSTLSESVGERTEFVDEKSLLTNERLVHVTDFMKRVTYLPVDQCKTFLHLRQCIEQQCLADADIDIDNCILHSGSSEEELSASQWPDLLKAQRSVIIYVRISRRKSALPAPSSSDNNGQKAIDGSSQPPLIEYKGLNSDESSDDGNRKALLVRRSTVHRQDSPDLRRTSRRTQALESSLRDQGYVVNNLNPLEGGPSSISTIKKPRVFKRPASSDQAVRIPERSQTVRFTEQESSKQSFGPGPSIALKGSSFDHAAESSRDSSLTDEYTDELQSEDLHNRGSLEGTHSLLESIDESRPYSKSLDRKISEVDAGGDAASTSGRGQDRSSQHNEKSAQNSLGSTENAANGVTDQPSTVSDDESSGSKSSIRSLDEETKLQRAATMQPTVDSEDDDVVPSPSIVHMEDNSRQVDIKTFEVGKDQTLDKTGGNLNTGAVALNSGEDPALDDTREEFLSETDKKPLAMQDLDLKHAFKEETNAALKRNVDELDKEVTKRIEEEMRKRLARFGFQENQIQAMIHPERAQTSQLGMTEKTPMASGTPRYPKVRKEHLDVDTLLYYDIPYEIDPSDPSYIIIFRELEQRETEILFEHTRRLRAGRTNKLSIEERSDNPGQEYAWIRRRKASRRATSRHEPKVVGVNRRSSITSLTDDRGGPSSKAGAKRRQQKSAEVTGEGASSPSPTIAEPDINLRVPPFLAWPDTIEQTEGFASKGGPNRSGECDDALTQLTLLEIENCMHKNRPDDGGLPVSLHHPFLASYRSGKAFVEIPERSLNDLKPIQDPERNSPQWNQALLDIRDELAFLKSIRDKPKFALSANLKKQSIATRTPRRVANWQISRLLMETNSLISSAQQLIDQFVSKQYPHVLLRRCWGAFYEISEVLANLGKENATQCNQESSNAFSLIYVIKDVPDRGYLETHGLEELIIPLDRCSVCSRFTRYPDIDDAFQHLQQCHIRKKESITPEDQKRLGHWLVSTASVEMERRNTEMSNLIGAIYRWIKKLLHKATEIRTGVADENREKPGHFLLPSDLVKAAEKTFQFIYTSLHAVRFLQGQTSGAAPNMKTSSIQLRDNIALVEHFGIAAETSLSNAQNELLLMAYTGSSDGTSIVQYTSAPPETTVLHAIFVLVSRPLLGDLQVEEHYRNHLSRLRYDAGRRPSKRALRELYLLEEELEIVCSVRLQQFEMLAGLKKVFDNKSYRITNQVRINGFELLEEPSLRRALCKRGEVEEEFNKLKDRLSGTAQVLKYNIEIAEEGHSKAILVFTLVTIVFLPLSFVASLFGMNTSDMRNMEDTQALFWAVALPLTAAVGSISLLTAYGGTQIRERIAAFGGRMRDSRKPKTEFKAPKPKHFRRRDEEEGGEIQPKLSPTPGKLNRRETLTSFNVSTKGKAAKIGRQRRTTMFRDNVVKDRRESRLRSPRRTSPKRFVGIKEMFY